jgi:hypothetical protein
MSSWGVVDSAAWVIIFRMLLLRCSRIWRWTSCVLQWRIQGDLVDVPLNPILPAEILPSAPSLKIMPSVLTAFSASLLPNTHSPYRTTLVPPPQLFRSRPFDASRINPPSPRAASQHHWGCYHSNISESAKLHRLVKPRPFVYCVCAVVSLHRPWGFLEESSSRGKSIIRSRTCGRVADECCEGRWSECPVLRLPLQLRGIGRVCRTVLLLRQMCGVFGGLNLVVGKKSRKARLARLISFLTLHQLQTVPPPCPKQVSVSQRSALHLCKMFHLSPRLIAERVLADG